MNKLKQTLEKVLKSESAFFDSESGELNYIKVKDSADSIDKKLITLLAENKDLKEKFFTSYFNTLVGTDELKKQLLAGKTEAEIRASWQQGLADYAPLRAKYLLYR